MPQQHQEQAPRSAIVLLLILYLLQGVSVGLIPSLSLYLSSNKASWSQQGTFNFAGYPFSLKLIWAPIIDSLYIRRLGRRQTWLLPIQLLLGLTMIILSFYLQTLLVELRVVALTIIFFLINFLTASQDVCVDGWALSLFASSNVQWQSTAQTIGQTFGRFISSSALMTLESANFTNRYVREPLGFQPQTHGLFTLEQFFRFWGIAFIVVTCCVAILCRQRRKSTTADEDEQKGIGLIETYLSIIKLFKKKCIWQLISILLVSPFGYAATYFMTNLALMGYGISRDTIGLITMPIILVKLLTPLVISNTRRPLNWFARSYVLRLIACLAIAVYIHFTPQLLPNKALFYSFLILLFAANESIVYLQLVARVGFYAQVSEPRIGGTYMTLVSSVGNLGQSISSTVVLHVATWLPKRDAYSIEVGICALIGFVWLALSWRLMQRLQDLPVEKWYLVKTTASIQQHNSEVTLQTIVGEMELKNRTLRTSKSSNDTSIDTDWQIK